MYAPYIIWADIDSQPPAATMPRPFRSRGSSLSQLGPDSSVNWLAEKKIRLATEYGINTGRDTFQGPQDA